MSEVKSLSPAGKNVGAAFGDIKGLFLDIAQFTTRLKEFSKRQMPEPLGNLVSGLLVSLLGLCALATKKTLHVAPEKKHHKIKNIFSSAASNAKEFGVMLAFGEDAEISSAKSGLARLIDEEARLVATLSFENMEDIKEGTGRIESVVVDIKGLSFDIRGAVFELQADSAEIKFLQISTHKTVERIEVTIADVSVRMLDKTQFTAAEEEKKARDKVMTNMLSTLIAGQHSTKELDSGRLEAAKAGRTQASKSSVKESNRLKSPKDRLKPQTASQHIYERVKSESVSGTGEWIFKEDLVRQWMNREITVLCISGDTGAGATFLAARLIGQLQEDNKPSDTSTPSIAYFFCKSELKELTTVTNMLRSAAYQIAETNKDYASYVDAKINEGSGVSVNVSLLWEALFEGFFDQSRGAAYLVVDALDECDEDEVTEFVQNLKSTMERDPQQWLRNLSALLVVNSRLTGQLSSAFDHSTASFYTLERVHSEVDIRTLVQTKINKNWKDRLITASLYEHVQTALLSAPQSNFLWASLVLVELTSLSQEDAIRERLEDLPADVKSATLLVLRKLARTLDKYGKEDLNDILAWVGCSRRLSLAHLDAVLTLRRPLGARVTNLDSLIAGDFGGLFIVSDADDSSLLSEEKIRQRLGEEDALATDDASVIEHDNPVDTSTIQVDRVDNEKQNAGLLKDGIDHRLASWSTQNIRLRHSLIGRFIEERRVDESLADLTTDRMHISVLLGCLQAICDTAPGRAEETLTYANRYCALYLPEPLSDVDVAEVELETKWTVAQCLMQVLRDERMIERWITYAGDYMRSDLLGTDGFSTSLLSWLNDPEVMELHADTDREWVEAAVKAPFTTLFEPLARGQAKRWLQTDVEEISSTYEFLNAWLAKAKQEAGGAAGPTDATDHDAAVDVDERDHGMTGAGTMNKAVNRGSDEYGEIQGDIRGEADTSDSEIGAGESSESKTEVGLQSAEGNDSVEDRNGADAGIEEDEHGKDEYPVSASKTGTNDDGKAEGGDDDSHNGGDANEEEQEKSHNDGKLEDSATYTLASSDADRIMEVARWFGFEETAHWHHRIGSALTDAEQYATAVKVYELAIQRKPEEAKLHAGLALTYENCSPDVLANFREAIIHMQKAIELLDKQMEPSQDAPKNVGKDLEKLYLDCVRNLALWYKCTRQTASAVETYERLLEDWETQSEDLLSDPVIGFSFYVNMLSDSGREDDAIALLERLEKHPTRNLSVFRLIYGFWLDDSTKLTQLAYKTGRSDVVCRFWQEATKSLARYAEDGNTGAARYFHTVAILRLRPSETAAAIANLEKVLADVELSNPSNMFHWIKERAERELAMIYLQRALQAREQDHWQLVGTNVEAMARLCRTDPEAEDSTVVDRECSSIIAAWNRLNGRRHRAMRNSKLKMLRGINVLTDDDPENDLTAWQCIADASLSVGDIERAAAAVGMQKQICLFGTSIIKDVTQVVEEDTDQESESKDVKQEEAATEQGEVETATGQGPPSQDPIKGASEVEHNLEGQASAGAHDCEQRTPTEPLPPTLTMSEPSPATLVVNGSIAQADHKVPSVIDFGKTASGTCQGDNASAKNLDIIDAVVDEPAKPDLTERSEKKESSDTDKNADVLGTAAETTENNDNNESADDDDDDDDSWISYTCDGVCFNRIPNKKAFWRCSYCISDFCESCNALLASGTMEGFSICGESHERFLMPAVRERFPEDCIRVGDRNVPIKEWLDAMKAEWGKVLNEDWFA